MTLQTGMVFVSPISSSRLGPHDHHRVDGPAEPVEVHLEWSKLLSDILEDTMMIVNYTPFHQPPRPIPLVRLVRN